MLHASLLLAALANDPVHDEAGNVTTAPRPGRGAETDAEETALTLLYDAGELGGQVPFRPGTGSR